MIYLHLILNVKAMTIFDSNNVYRHEKKIMDI